MKILAIITVLLVILVGLYYWYRIKPIHLKKGDTIDGRVYLLDFTTKSYKVSYRGRDITNQSFFFTDKNQPKIDDYVTVTLDRDFNS